MSGEYFEVYSRVEGTILTGQKLQWRWRLKSGNHQTIASGEGYDEKRSCLHAIELLKSTTKNTPMKEVEK